MNDVLESGLWALAVAVVLCVFAISTRGCYDANQRKETEAIKACVASERSSIDCALIVRGTGNP